MLTEGLSLNRKGFLTVKCFIAYAQEKNRWFPKKNQGRSQEKNHCYGGSTPLIMKVHTYKVNEC
jgi:hypothetical protein